MIVSVSKVIKMAGQSRVAESSPWFRVVHSSTESLTVAATRKDDCTTGERFVPGWTGTIPEVKWHRRLAGGSHEGQIAAEGHRRDAGATVSGRTTVEMPTAAR
jgi:hypothetical protein